jgi:hypothetical protein
MGLLNMDIDGEFMQAFFLLNFLILILNSMNIMYLLFQLRK